MDTFSAMSASQFACFQVFQIAVNSRSDEYSSSHALPKTDWRKFLLVTGYPGCGKTFMLRTCIQFCLDNDLSPAVATPTGCLACVYKEEFQDRVLCDTVHATFHIPAREGEHHTVNWNLCHADVLFIDEVSQISCDTFNL